DDGALGVVALEREDLIDVLHPAGQAERVASARDLVAEEHPRLQIEAVLLGQQRELLALHLHALLAQPAIEHGLRHEETVACHGTSSLPRSPAGPPLLRRPGCGSSG